MPRYPSLPYFLLHMYIDGGVWEQRLQIPNVATLHDLEQQPKIGLAPIYLAALFCL